MKGLNLFDLFENFDFRLFFFEKTLAFKGYFHPKGGEDLYADTIENRWSSHMRKNRISNNLKMTQY